MAAFTLPSKTHKTNSSLKLLFEFLTDFKNFKSILPEDKVEDFKYENDQCSFSIKGITPMVIKLAEKEPYHYILFTSEGLAKFNFSLKVFFEGDAEQTGTCRIDLSGDLNPIILSMAQKSLEGLANTMALKLSELKV